MLSDQYLMHRTCPFIWFKPRPHPSGGSLQRQKPVVSIMTITFDWVDIFLLLEMHMNPDMCSKFFSIVSDHTVGFWGRGSGKTAILGTKISVFPPLKQLIFLCRRVSRF